MKKYLLLMALALLSACSLFQQVQNKRFQRYSDALALIKQQDPAIHWDSVVLDNSFRLYVRQVCRKRPPKGYYTSGEPNLPAAVTRCNCEESLDPNPEKLEVQYLFYSPLKKQFVYITTIPPYVDRSQADWRNTYDLPLFRLENFANINYFNTFFFGRVGDRHLKMAPMGEDYPYQIDYTLSADEQVLNFDKLSFNQPKMKTGDPSRELGTPIKFYRKDNWRIGLDDRPFDATIIDAHNNYLENRTIYLLSAASDDQHRPTDILFYFKADYSGIAGENWHWLHFEDFRIKSY